MSPMVPLAPSIAATWSAVCEYCPAAHPLSASDAATSSAMDVGTSARRWRRAVRDTAVPLFSTVDETVKRLQSRHLRRNGCWHDIARHRSAGGRAWHEVSCRRGGCARRAHLLRMVLSELAVRSV